MPDKATTETMNRQGWYEGDRRPIPDPTILTTQQLVREITSVRELYDIRLTAMDKNVETRLSAMDKAVALLQALMDKSPSIAELYAKHEQMFKSIQTQFQERDIRTEQTARDSKVAVDAALQAAKEAVGEQNKSSALAISKSEAATTKQIDQISTLIATGQKGLDDKIDDIKTRLTSIEGNKQGASETKQGTATNWGLVFGGIGMFVGVLGIALAIAVFFKH